MKIAASAYLVSTSSYQNCHNNKKAILMDRFFVAYGRLPQHVLREQA
ncbi:hypothetical protein KXJ72_04350 [Comamonas aquatica]|nr:hypothetical protein KXJ72_04350 [Comamonas aquatica]